MLLEAPGTNSPAVKGGQSRGPKPRSRGTWRGVRSTRRHPGHSGCAARGSNPEPAYSRDRRIGSRGGSRTYSCPVQRTSVACLNVCEPGWMPVTGHHGGTTCKIARPELSASGGWNWRQICSMIPSFAAAQPAHAETRITRMAPGPVAELDAAGASSLLPAGGPMRRCSPRRLAVAWAATKLGFKEP